MEFLAKQSHLEKPCVLVLQMVGSVIDQCQAGYKTTFFNALLFAFELKTSAKGG